MLTVIVVHASLTKKSIAVDNDKQTSVAKELEDLKKKYMKLKQQSKLDRSEYYPF